MFLQLIVSLWLFNTWGMVMKGLNARSDFDKAGSVVVATIYLAIPCLSLWYYGFWSVG